MKSIVIIGSGGLAKEVAWLIEEKNKEHNEWNLIGYISDDTKKEAYRYPILGNDDWLLNNTQELYAICAIGNPTVRKAVINKYKNKNNIVFPSIISNYAVISDSVSIGAGTVICAGCIVTVDISIGNFVICDRNSTIGHDSTIEDYVTISPGVNVSGNVHIDEYSMIGTGTSIIQGINLGRKCTIGAGATVINNIPDNCTAVGVPAKIIKH